MARPPWLRLPRRVALTANPPGFEGFTVTTLDGVPISGVRVGPPSPADAVVLCHGFLGSWRRPQNVNLARSLAARYAVYTFDFRGHGASHGRSTVGDREALDVHAVVTLARAHGHPRVVAVGASMGAVSVLREAARFRDVDGVVSISSPGRWVGHGGLARLSGYLVTTRLGRAVARRAFRTHVHPEWTWSPPPVDVIEQVDCPVLIVHGTEDRFLSTVQAELLFARARHPKRLLILDDFGHAELGYSSRFAALLAEEIDGMLGGKGWGMPSGARQPALP